MSDELVVLKLQTATKSPRFSVNLNNKKLSFPCETNNVPQELPKISSKFPDTESTAKKNTMVSRIPKDSDKYIKNTYQKIVNHSDVKKRLSIKLIDVSGLDDQMSKTPKDVNLMPPDKKRRSTRLVIKSTGCSLSPRTSIDSSSDNNDFLNKSYDGENKLNFTAAVNKALMRKVPARFAVVPDLKPNSKPKALPVINLKEDLKLLLENTFGNLNKEFLIEKKHRDTTDVPLMPNILKRMNDENWKWEAPQYDCYNDEDDEEDEEEEENNSSEKNL